MIFFSYFQTFGIFSLRKRSGRRRQEVAFPFLQKPQKLFLKGLTLRALFCCCHESGWKYPSTIFKPTPKHILRISNLSRSKNRKNNQGITTSIYFLFVLNQFQTLVTVERKLAIGRNKGDTIGASFGIQSSCVFCLMVSEHIQKYKNTCKGCNSRQAYQYC